jgi:hypothetical protein
MPGQFVCYYHGGASDSGREKGEQRLAALKAKDLVMFDPNFDESPEEGLMREVLWSAQIAAAYGMAVAELDGMVVFSHGQGEKMKALIDAWTAERKLHAQLCKLAMDAGIERKRLDVLEKQADVLVQILSAVLGDPRIGLTEEQVIEAKVVAVEAMRAIPKEARTGTPMYDNAR